jgi:hypothetical protein
MRNIIEGRRDRLALAEDAGLGRVSGTSVLAGILVAYGAFAVVAGLTAAVLRALNLNVDVSGEDLRQAGTAGGIVLGAVLFVSWFFGGYVAGRMARRAGTTQGLLVFVFGVFIAIAAATVVEASGATGDVVRGLRNLGVPTSADQWRQIGTVAGIASLAGMFLGAVLGGTMGERWHTKLVHRALDPGVGPEAVARAAQAKAVRSEERRHELILTDEYLDRVDQAEETEATVDAGQPVKPKTRTRKPKPRVTSSTSNAGGDGQGATRTRRRSAAKKPTGQEARPEKNGPS